MKIIHQEEAKEWIRIHISRKDPTRTGKPLECMRDLGFPIEILDFVDRMKRSHLVKK